MCEAPQAREVSLVGDFNEWRNDKHPMKMNKQGRWTKVVWLLPGTYEYKFRIDGVWQKDAHNSNKCRNCYGTSNSLLIIGAE